MLPRLDQDDYGPQAEEPDILAKTEQKFQEGRIDAGVVRQYLVYPQEFSGWLRDPREVLSAIRCHQGVRQDWPLRGDLWYQQSQGRSV